MTRFHEYPLTYELVKKLIPGMTSDIYFPTLLESAKKKPAMYNQAVTEYAWYRNHKPYYNLYPGVVRGFTNLRLDMVNSQQIKLPVPEIAVRFMDGKESLSFTHEGVVYKLKSMLVGDNIVQDRDEQKIITWCDIGELDQSGEIVTTYMVMLKKEEYNCEQAIHCLPDCSSFVGPTIPDDMRRDIFRIICALSLIDQDPELIEFDVLNADREKYLSTLDNKYIEKAKKRGKHGWVIGRRTENELDPTYVNPHFQHYHVGAGRSSIIYKRKKGFFTKRDKIVQVPTGHE